MGRRLVCIPGSFENFLVALGGMLAQRENALRTGQKAGYPVFVNK
jgi:hypothetical protein